ncbi:hypothetical protein ACFVYE_08535 [Streptomyces sp. NPDC058239]|uniref:hypothetical protein n=1 Tax=unclassified Streptomyces TaxID=2593676 RepID=UPI003665BEC2
MTTILRLPAEPGQLTLPALLLHNAEDHGDRPALSWRAGGRRRNGSDDPHLAAGTAQDRRTRHRVQRT